MSSRCFDRLGEFVENDYILIEESIRIIVDDKTVELFNNCEFNEGLTLGDCLKIAKELLDYPDAGIILVIAESYLDGYIYRYGNYVDEKYGSKWQCVGFMEGFA